MLSGIRTVKRVTGRKRKEKEQEQSRLPVEEVVATKDVTRVSPNRDDKMESTASDGGTTRTAAHKSSTRIISKEANVAVAQELRKLLSNGIPIQSTDDDNVCSLVDRHTEQLLQKIVTASASKTGSSSSSSFTLMDDTSSPNECRYPAMGTKTAAATDMSSMTIDQLRREELTQRQSMDEIYARNISRLGSRYQNTDFTSGSNIPETEYDIGENNSTTMFTHSSSAQKKRRGQTNPAFNNTNNRNYCNVQPKYGSVTNANIWHSHNKNWSSTWWFHSSSFRKHLLLAIGNYVSLALASAQDSIFDGHCYLVPNQPTESFLSCNSLDRQQFWEEVDRFQSALRTMFWNSFNHRTIFCEMTIAGQQARMDVIPCPPSVQHDAPLYFHASFLERQKLLTVDDDEYHNPTSTSPATRLHKITAQQKITQLPFQQRSSANKAVFPYISVEWAKNEGYAQILTVDANKRAKDNNQRWYLDTMAAMLNVEPIHLRNKKLQNFDDKRQNHHLMTKEKYAVWKFLQVWKSYDFTDQNK